MHLSVPYLPRKAGGRSGTYQDHISIVIITVANMVILSDSLAIAESAILIHCFLLSFYTPILHGGSDIEPIGEGCIVV